MRGVCWWPLGKGVLVQRDTEEGQRLPSPCLRPHWLWCLGLLGSLRGGEQAQEDGQNPHSWWRQEMN